MAELLVVPVFVTLFLGASLALKLPSYAKACSRNDPKLNECIVKNGKAAIPEFIHGDPKYGVPDMDPFVIERLEIRQGTQQVGLTLVLTNLKMYGLKDMIFVAARADMNKKHMEWYFKAPKGVQMVGPYTASGKVLLLPITGDGLANITINDFDLTFTFDFDLIDKKGKKYMNITTKDFKFDVRGGKVHLGNLFNGDKLLGDNTNRFLNENWKELVQTLGPEMGAALKKVFENLLRSIASLVPYDDIYPPGKV